MSAIIQQCRTCGADIYWLKHSKTGKAAPIEVAERDDGNVLVDLSAGTYSITFKGHHRVNHFMTCPQAKTWAKLGRQP